MPIVVGLIKVLSLATVLLCGGTILIGSPTVELASKIKPSRSQCRIYFGCPPLALAVAHPVQQ